MIIMLYALRYANEKYNRMRKNGTIKSRSIFYTAAVVVGVKSIIILVQRVDINALSSILVL